MEMSQPWWEEAEKGKLMDRWTSKMGKQEDLTVKGPEC